MFIHRNTTDSEEVALFTSPKLPRDYRFIEPSPELLAALGTDGVKCLTPASVHATLTER